MKNELIQFYSHDWSFNPYTKNYHRPILTNGIWISLKLLWHWTTLTLYILFANPLKCVNLLKTIQPFINKSIIHVQRIKISRILRNIKRQSIHPRIIKIKIIIKSPSISEYSFQFRSKNAFPTNSPRSVGFHYGWLCSIYGRQCRLLG